MRIFVTGASGFIGTAAVAELLAAGHQVLGLARSDAAAQRIAALGATAHRGALSDRVALQAGAQAADAVLHLAFEPDFSRFEEVCALDQQAIEGLGEAIAGTAKPLIVPNGLAGLSRGRPIAESDDVPPHYPFPRVSEQTALRLAATGVIASVVRLAQVHDAAKQGLVGALVQVARATGKSAYIGNGENRWPAVHVADAARLLRLALEASVAGARYHAVAEEGISLRVIATEIGRALKLPVVSLPDAEAAGHFGALRDFAAEDMPAASSQTENALRWHPTGPRLLADLRQLR